MNPKSNIIGVFTKRGVGIEHTDTQGRKPCEDGGKNWDGESTISRISGNGPKLEERHGADFSWKSVKHLILNF